MASTNKGTNCSCSGVELIKESGRQFSNDTKAARVKGKRAAARTPPRANALIERGACGEEGEPERSVIVVVVVAEGRR